MSGGSSQEYRVDDDGVFSAPLVVAYPYKRTLGPVIGRFLTGLRDGVILGVKGSDGRVLVPAPDYDPATGAAVGRSDDDWVTVGPGGTVATWTDGLALITLDGADSALLHRTDGPGVRTGARVQPRWKSEREGSINDIEAFEVVS